VKDGNAVCLKKREDLNSFQRNILSRIFGRRLRADHITKKTQLFSSLAINQWNSNVKMGGRCEGSRCRTYPLTQLVVEFVEWNGLEAVVIGGRGWTAGCSAVGGME